MMSTTETPGRQTEIGRCPLCGAPLETPDKCGKCDWMEGYREGGHRANPVDLTACLLSIVPGAGHFYKGHRGLGFFYAGLALVAAFFCGLAGFASAGFGICLLPLYWAWVMTHAYWIEDLKAQERPRDPAP